uniref:Uncharacterized protein n=1 Tax=viral metagenome TaxID=1070528 RepID=A0A6M3LXH4_9ZZZZ
MPDFIPPELENIETLHNLSIVGKLTNNQRRILAAIASNVVREDKQSEGALAEEIGLSRQAFYNARQNPTFSAALTLIMRDIVKGMADHPIRNLLNLAQKDTKANEILLRIAEVYQPTNRNLNLNANLSVNGDAVGSPGAAIQSTVQQFMGIGYDKQSLLDLVAETWDKLKSEGL